MLAWFEFINSSQPAAIPSTKAFYSLEEIALHNKEDDCWMVIEGKVYDLTSFLKFHPGGIPILRPFYGKDATEAFLKFHSWVSYEKILSKCLLGRTITG